MYTITFYSTQSRRDWVTSPMTKDATSRFVEYLYQISFVNNIRVKEIPA